MTTEKVPLPAAYEHVLLRLPLVTLDMVRILISRVLGFVSWSLVDLQSPVSFRCTAKSFSSVYFFPDYFPLQVITIRCETVAIGVLRSESCSHLFCVQQFVFVNPAFPSFSSAPGICNDKIDAHEHMSITEALVFVTRCETSKLISLFIAIVGRGPSGPACVSAWVNRHNFINRGSCFWLCCSHLH